MHSTAPNRSFCRGTRAARFAPGTARRPRGMVLLVVLVVVALLSLTAIVFCDMMLTEREAAELVARQAQARAMADSGLDAARLFLGMEKEAQDDAGGWYDNAQRFRGRLIVDGEHPRGRGRFTLVAPRLEDGRWAGLRFGLEDASTRVNLNTLLLADDYADGGGRHLLMGLPGMTEPVADAILDWIDEDDETREFGAEVDYYTSLEPPYAPKNGPLESVEELLLVRGVTPWLLFGCDANRNGSADPTEPDPESLPDVDNSQRDMDRGWAAYMTLYSVEANVQPDGSPKVYLNQEDMENLYDELKEAVGPQWATFIVAFKQYGPNPGSSSDMAAPTGQIDFSKSGDTPITTTLDLIGSDTKVKYVGEKEKPLETPFPDGPLAMGTYLPVLLDHVTATPSPLIPGRININQAPRTVLEGIPGMTPETVDEIVARRNSDPLDAEPRRRHETWLASEGIVTLEEMKALMPFVTCGGSVYHVQAVGYFDQGGPAARIEAVLDATVQPARMISYREISHLGAGYPRELLGIEAGEMSEPEAPSRSP